MSLRSLLPVVAASRRDVNVARVSGLSRLLSAAPKLASRYRLIALAWVLGGFGTGTAIAAPEAAAPKPGKAAAHAGRSIADYHAVDIKVLPEGTEEVDVFLLLGQSNMKGRGTVPADQVDDPRIVMMHLQDDRWYYARHPLHGMDGRNPLGGSENAGVGPGLDFARRIAAEYPRRRIALVPGAVGGSGIERWVKGAPLYEAAIKRARLALAQGPAGHVRLRGILWIQGEREAREKDRALAYPQKLDGMIRAMREDLGQPELPFIASTAGPVQDTEAMKTQYPYRSEVNAALLDLPKRVPFSMCVDSRDLTGHIGDKLHYDTPSQEEIGRRMAAAWLKLTAGR